MDIGAKPRQRAILLTHERRIEGCLGGVEARGGAASSASVERHTASSHSPNPRRRCRSRRKRIRRGKPSAVLASEGLIGRLKREVYVAVVKHISTAWINFEVKRRGASASIRFNYAAAKPAALGGPASRRFRRPPRLCSSRRGILPGAESGRYASAGFSRTDSKRGGPRKSAAQFLEKSGILCYLIRRCRLEPFVANA